MNQKPHNTAIKEMSSSPIKNRKTNDTNCNTCLQPLFKNDPVYMEGFNQILNTFHTNIQTYNLQYLIDRIKKLEETKKQKGYASGVGAQPTNLEIKLKESLSNLLKTTTTASDSTYSSEIRQQLTRKFISQLKDNFLWNESTTQVESGTKVFMSSNSSPLPSPSSSSSSSSSSLSSSNFQSLPLSLLAGRTSSISFNTTSLRHSYNLRSTVESSSKTKNSNQN